MGMMTGHKLSDNAKLSERMLRLIVEVKTLNSS